MTTTSRNIHIALATAAFALAAFFAPPAFAQLGDIPALIRTTIPTGDPDGGRISYSIALGEGRELRITVDAGRLVVTVSGTVKDQFKIFRMDEGGFVPLECSAGFLGAIVGNISCRDVEPGTRLVFARKDLVDQLIPEAAAGGFDEFTTGEDEFALEGDEDEDVDFFGFGDEEEEGEEFIEKEPSWLDNAIEGAADFFGFGEEDEGEVDEDEFVFDGDGGEDVDFFGAGEDEEEGEEFTEKEPSWFNDAVEGVADFFGFGEEEESEEFVDEADELFDAAGEDEFAFEDEDEVGFAEGEAVTDDGDLAFGEAGRFDELTTGEDELVFGEDGEEFAEGEEEPLLPRIWREIRETAEAVQNKVSDFIAKLYVKPLPLAPEAMEGDVFTDEFDKGAKFLEEPTESDSAPAATVNEAFQRFINGLGQ